jgi:hypothetical protein
MWLLFEKLMTVCADIQPGDGSRLVLMVRFEMFCLPSPFTHIPGLFDILGRNRIPAPRNNFDTLDAVDLLRTRTPHSTCEFGSTQAVSSPNIRRSKTSLHSLCGIRFVNP